MQKHDTAEKNKSKEKILKNQILNMLINNTKKEVLTTSFLYFIKT